MKIKIITTYDNVTEEFLENWLSGMNLPELHCVVEEIRECGHAVFKSKDPDSDCIGTTEYLVIK